MARISYKRHRFPPAVIQHAVWLYFRFTLSLRDVEEMMAHRGVDVSYETIRVWTLKWSCPRTFSNRHGQVLISLRFILRAGLYGSLRGRRLGRMFAFRIGWIEVVCAVVAAVIGAISPSHASRLDAFGRA